MSFNDQFQKFSSFFFPIKLKTFHSQYSGELFIYRVNGKKILDTTTVNYSFNSLHKVFRKAFAQTELKAQNIKNVLVLGLGGGSIINLLRTNYHIKATITAVEIDPIIVGIAESEFNIHKYDPINIITSDAEEWIKKNSSTFDIICVDLFINAEVPSVFLTPEFANYLLVATNNDGTIYFNIMIMNDKINSSFNTIYNHFTENSSKSIKSATYIEVEENNRVLIIKK